MCEQNAAIEELTKHGGTVDVEEMEPSADNLDRPALLLLFQDPGHILGDGNNEECQSNPTELSTDIQHVSTAAKSNDSYKHSDHNSRQTDLATTQQCMNTNADTTQLEGDIFEAACSLWRHCYSEGVSGFGWKGFNDKNRWWAWN